MTVKTLAIGLVFLGLTGFLLALSFGAFNRDSPRTPGPAQVADAAIPTITPRPTVTPTPAPSRLISHAEVCRGTVASKGLTQVPIVSNRSAVIARVYCRDDQVRYVDYVGDHGEIERTYLLEAGRVLVKLYYDTGAVIKREDFDRDGNPVPDGSVLTLSSYQIQSHR